VAHPSTLWLGETVNVTLTLAGECPPDVAVNSDGMLVVDHSGSMGADNKMAEAIAAATRFVDGLDLGRHRAGLVAFNHLSELLVPLGTDAPRLRQELGGLVATGGTDIAQAVQMADDHLRMAARSDALGVIVLLTDGQAAVEPALRAAAFAKARGVLIFTIGLGSDVNADLLRSMASSPQDYFFAPAASDLAAIYQRISRVVQSFAVTNVLINDVMWADVDYERGTARPVAVVGGNGQRLNWGRAALPTTGMTLTYTVRPRRTGTYPTNERATADYTDLDGVRRTFVFPQPIITVLGPSATPGATGAPSPIPSASASPTPRWRDIYLPVAYDDRCFPGQRHADVGLVIDTSSSMTGPKLEAAKAAAKIFVDLLALPQDQAAVVSFDREGRVEQPLTGERAALLTAIDRLQNRSGTRIDLGVLAGVGELTSVRQRAGNNRVLVVLTDGRQEGGNNQTVLDAAVRARTAGVTIYAVGLGSDADQALLRQVAGDASHFYFAPDSGDLRAIYAAIAGAIPCD
jgi:Mg-chelatase subunit ChlD